MANPDDLRRERLKALYDVELFSTHALAAIAALGVYLLDAETNPQIKIWKSPQTLLQEEQTFFAEAQKKLTHDPKPLMQRFLSTSNKLHSPHYMGHQVPPPIPLASIFDFLGSATNQAPGLYEMGPLPAVAEKIIFAELMRIIGWDSARSTGVVTQGGSLANLTALLAARNVRYPLAWTQGLTKAAQGKTPVIVTSEDTHYSISRAAGVLGMGSEHVLSVKLDSQRRMDGADLSRVLHEAEHNNQDVFAIIATAGTTPIGAFDPLEEIGAIANSKNIWFHVDAAHGGGVLFSETHRHLMKGIERADSIIWDAHKMLHVPALCTFILYKEKAPSYTAFQQDAPYVHDPSKPDDSEFDSIPRLLECTRRPSILGLFGIWSTFGPQVFSDLSDLLFANTKRFAECLKRSASFEALHEPESNILCFRFKTETLANRPQSEGIFQKQLRDLSVRAGKFYITATRLNGNYCLRITVINPFTEVKHFEELLFHLEELAQSAS